MTVVLILTPFFLITVAIWLWSLTVPQTATSLVKEMPGSGIGLFPEKRDWVSTMIVWDFRLLPFFLLAALSGWSEGIGWLTTIGTIGVLILLAVPGISAVGAGERPAAMMPILDVRFVGHLDLRKRMYIGDSRAITLTLITGSWSDPWTSNRVEAYEQRDGKLIVVNVEDKARAFLEVELLAAGVTVDGEKKQRQPLLTPKLSFRWNCNFGVSGNLLVTFVFRHVREGEVREVGIIEHPLKVVIVDHLTKRQVWVIASVLTILSAMITLHGPILKLLNYP